MKNLIYILWLTITCILLTSCYPSCATGDPLGLFTYCSKKSYEALYHPKPYGAHWVKDGMTRESRREDMTACGSVGRERAEFTDNQIETSTNPDDAEKYGDRAYYKAKERLRKKWIICMKDKGYVYLQDCDSRCICEKGSCHLEGY